MSLWEAFQCEQEVQSVLTEQAQRGVLLDKIKTGFYIHSLTEKILEIDRLLIPQMPRSLEKGCLATKPFLKSGKLNQNVSNWLEKEGLEMEIRGPFCGVSWIDFDMGRTEAVKEHLGKLGWIPSEYSWDDITMHASKRPLTPPELQATVLRYMETLKKSVFGPLKMAMLEINRGMPKQEVINQIIRKKKVPKGPILTEDSLDGFEGGEIGLMLKQRLTLSHRRALLKGFLRDLRADGRISAEAITIGTPTYRMRHKTVVNVPKVSVLYGKQCRSVLRVAKGRKMVGCDASGLELRMLAHYINDPAYTSALLDGDIHTYNQRAAGLPTRDSAKTFIYAWLYGAGDAKIGAIIGGDASAGKKIKAKFLAANKALARLIEDVKEEGASGVLVGIDGRLLRLRRGSDGEPMVHKALNLLLQSAGSIVVKYWTVLCNQMIRGENLDAHQVIHMHDEFQYDVAEKDVKRVMEIMEQSIIQTGVNLGLNCPLAGEAKCGNNWAQTH